jgi:hypothetical protein
MISINRIHIVLQLQVLLPKVPLENDLNIAIKRALKISRLMISLISILTNSLIRCAGISQSISTEFDDAIPYSIGSPLVYCR